MHNEEKSLIGIAASLVVDVIENIQASVQNSIQEKTQNLVRKAIAVFLCIVGVLFFLSGLVALIEEYVGNNWIGDIGVGAAAMLVGIIFLKNNH